LEYSATSSVDVQFHKRIRHDQITSPTTNGAPLPRNLGNLAPGQWATNVIIFAGANNPPGAKRTLTFGGTYSGGTFTEKWKVSLP
jgi:hypothetical protein